MALNRPLELAFITSWRLSLSAVLSVLSLILPFSYYIPPFFHMFLLVYVDDIIFTSNNISAINSLILSLQAKFKLKDLGTL